MLRKAGALIVSLMASTGALAQSLECTRFQSQDKGTYGQANPIEAPLGAGYFLTGGGCQFDVMVGQNPPGPDPNGIPTIYWERPTGNGFACKAGPPNSTSYIFTTATALGCRIAPRIFGNDPTLNAPLSNDGLGGDTVAVARTALPTDSNKPQPPVPYSIRACNNRGGAVLTVDLGNQPDVSLPWGESGKFAHQCIEVDNPSHVYFRTRDTVSVDEYGVYTLFAPGTFPKLARVGLPTTNIDDKRITVGKFNNGEVACAKTTPGGPVDASYDAYCNLDDLKGGNNYRICTDDGYSAQGDGNLEYPGSLMRIIINDDYAKKPKPANPDSYQYMPIAPKTCRDLFGVRKATLLIFDNTWNNQSVSKFLFRYAVIPEPTPKP
jgi:hypothetical protein